MDKLSVILLGIAFVGSLAVHGIFNIPLGIAFLILFVAWPLGGTLVTIDDDFRGGWSNPDGSKRAPWLQSPFWGQLIGGCGLSAAGFAIDAGWHSLASLRLWLLAVGAGFLSAALITRKWWLATGSLAALVALWV